MIGELSPQDPKVTLVAAMILTQSDDQEPWPPPSQEHGKAPSVRRILRKMRNVTFRNKILREMCIWDVMEA